MMNILIRSTGINMRLTRRRITRWVCNICYFKYYYQNYMNMIKQNGCNHKTQITGVWDPSLLTSHMLIHEANLYRWVYVSLF